MNHRSIQNTGLILAALSLIYGCMELPTEGMDSPNEKRRSNPLSSDSWGELQSQDIAILLPRVAGEGIGARLATRDGTQILQERWLKTVSNAFEPTAVEDALDIENWYGDWELVSIRIAPCSPLGNIPGRASAEFCWPEVRLVWQPNQYDFWIGWREVEAHSDDRAIHALYRVYPDSDRATVETLISKLQKQETRSRGDMARLQRMREGVVAQLLGDVVALRSDIQGSFQYADLDLRSETMGSDEESTDFYKRLAGFLSDYATPGDLHTLTSFSLPAGRNPAGDDTWVFLAFDGDQGELRQRPIQVRSPQTGDIIFDYGADETVNGATGDLRIRTLIENAGPDARAVADQIVAYPNDRARLKERINDPNQTLVANTSCGTCHSFNDLSFDFHNLSYLQEMEMTIAPRVRNDVTADLSWLRKR